MTKRGFCMGYLIVAITVLLVTGCAQGPIPKDHFYRLEVTTPDAGIQLPAGSFEVHRLSADDLTNGRAMVYSKQGHPNELLGYHYHFWVESPATMVQQQLVQFLRAAGESKSVTTPGLRIDTDYVVNGRILRLERVVGSTPAAALELELVVKQSRPSKPLLIKTYQMQVPASDQSVAATVDAMNQALSRIFALFLQDLSNSRLKPAAAGTP